MIWPLLQTAWDVGYDGGQDGGKVITNDKAEAEIVQEMKPRDAAPLVIEVDTNPEIVSSVPVLQRVNYSIFNPLPLARPSRHP